MGTQALVRFLTSIQWHCSSDLNFSPYGRIRSFHLSHSYWSLHSNRKEEVQKPTKWGKVNRNQVIPQELYFRCWIPHCSVFTLFLFMIFSLNIDIVLNLSRESKLLNSSRRVNKLCSLLSLSSPSLSVLSLTFYGWVNLSLLAAVLACWASPGAACYRWKARQLKGTNILTNLPSLQIVGSQLGWANWFLHQSPCTGNQFNREKQSGSLIAALL